MGYRPNPQNPRPSTTLSRVEPLYPRYETTRYVDDETYATWFRGHPQPGDILFVCKGAPGTVAMVPDPVDFCIAQDMVAVRADARKVHPNYLFAALRSREIQTQIESMHVGTMIPHFKKGDFPRLRIPMPPAELQEFIGDVYVELSMKIESNRRAMRDLGDLFMLECEAIVAETDAFDTKRMVELAELSLGGTPARANPAFWVGGEIPWINSGCLHERPVVTPADYITQLGLERSATKMIPAGSTVVAITGATLGVVSRLAMACAINQSIVAISAPDEALNTYLHFWMRSNIATLVSSASGAAQQHVNKSNFEELEVDVPTGDALELIGQCAGLFDHEVLLANENQTLTALRDALLPELLSGRLRVRDAEQAVSEAL